MTTKTLRSLRSLSIEELASEAARVEEAQTVNNFYLGKITYAACGLPETGRPVTNSEAVSIRRFSDMSGVSLRQLQLCRAMHLFWSKKMRDESPDRWSLMRSIRVYVCKKYPNWLEDYPNHVHLKLARRHAMRILNLAIDKHWTVEGLEAELSKASGNEPAVKVNLGALLDEWAAMGIDPHDIDVFLKKRSDGRYTWTTQ